MRTVGAGVWGVDFVGPSRLAEGNIARSRGAIGMCRRDGLEMIVVAVDPHLAVHVAAAVDLGTGAVLAEGKFGNDRAGYAAIVAWCDSLGDRRAFALEDVRGLTVHLERHLLLAGEQVVRVAPRLTMTARRRDRLMVKTDQVDARSIARAVLEVGLERFPLATINEVADEIRLLGDHRVALIRERVRSSNRALAHLRGADPAFRSCRLADPAPRRAVHADLDALPEGMHQELAHYELARIDEIEDMVARLDKRLAGVVRRVCPALLDICGCGVISATTLLGHVPDAHAFPTDGHFAQFAGVAPIKYGSGGATRHRMNRGGDRQVNAALHRIAITQKKTHYAPAQQYLDRKVAEGKTSRHALRCLKRRLARRVWQTLKTADYYAAERAAGNALDDTGFMPLGGAEPATGQLPAAPRATLGALVEARLLELDPLVVEYRQLAELKSRWSNALKCVKARR